MSKPTASELARPAGQGDDPVATDVIGLFEDHLGDVYGYLVRRCQSAAVAEDLAAETFLAAATAASHGHDDLNVAWLIGTARHKLVDHWRRDGRQRQALEELYDGGTEPVDSSEPVEAIHVAEVLARLLPHHRGALTLRYLDGLAVEDVARHLDRSVHATESLLMRAKAAYRHASADLARPDGPPGTSTGTSSGDRPGGQRPSTSRPGPVAPEGSAS